MNTSQHRAAAATKANWMLGCTSRGVTGRDRYVIIPHCSVLVRQLTTASSPGPRNSTDTHRLGRIQRRDMIKVPQNLLCGKKNEGLRSFHPGEEEVWGKLITLFQYLKVGFKEDRGFLFTRIHSEKTKGTEYELHQERFCLDIRKKLFTVRTIHHWNKVLRDVVDSSLVVFKT